MDDCGEGFSLTSSGGKRPEKLILISKSSSCSVAQDQPRISNRSAGEMLWRAVLIVLKMEDLDPNVAAIRWRNMYIPMEIACYPRFF
jgi:hypothetical protein